MDLTEMYPRWLREACEEIAAARDNRCDKPVGLEPLLLLLKTIRQNVDVF